MKYHYEPMDICCKQMDFDIDKIGDDYFINSVTFVGGCDGNHRGIASLIKGMKLEDVIKKLDGIKCGNKNTSCPDHIALALQMFLENFKYN